MNQLFGKLTYFFNYGHLGDFNLYLERLEQFFEINKIPDDMQPGILCSTVGESSYKMLREICHPTLPKNKTYAELCEILTKKFTETKSVFCERHKFYNLRQKRNENVKVWLTRIEELATDCKFDVNCYDSIIFDRFISGLRQSPILEKLSEVAHDTLTLERAVDIAVNKECTIKYFKDVRCNR